MTRSVPVVLGLALAAWPSTSYAAVLGVGAGGSCTYASVAAAVSVAASGDVILVAPGTWPANLGVIDKSLRFESGDTGCTAFDASSVVNIDGGGAQVMRIENAATVRLRNVNVGNGGGVQGGVVSVHEGAWLDVIDSAIGIATVTGHGGCVFVDGEGILWLDGDSTIAQCDAAGDGGGVYAKDDAFVVLSDRSRVTGNSAGGDGGGIFVSASNVSIADESEVSENEAGDDGGGIHAQSDANVTVHDSARVRDNDSTDQGGGIALFGADLAVGGNGTISGNVAGGGGGVFVHAAAADIGEDAIITANVARMRGGGVWVLGDPASPATLTLSGNASVTYNHATDGGGIFADESATSRVWATVAENTADNVGAGIAALGTVDAWEATIRGNRADFHGGGVFLAGGTAHTFVDVQFDDNDALDGNGGGLYVGAEASAIVRDGGGCDTSLLPIDEYCSAFTGNGAAADGGALYVAGVAEVDRTAFRMNAAAARGSAVRVVSGGDALIGNARVTENAASPTGGALDTNGTLIVHHATVAKNDSRGVVYAAGASGSVDRSILWNALTGAELYIDSGISLLVACSDVETYGGAGTHFGAGNISAAPLFVTTARGGFHLDAASPALSQCSLHSVSDAEDLDQEPRSTLFGARIDMGAFERP